MEFLTRDVLLPSMPMESPKRARFTDGSLSGLEQEVSYWSQETGARGRSQGPGVRSCSTQGGDSVYF